MVLERFIKSHSNPKKNVKPAILNLRNQRHHIQFTKLLKKKNINLAVDDYREQLKEYFEIKNPSLVFKPDFAEKWKQYLMTEIKKAPLWQQGRWVYFPWSKNLVHILEEKKFFAVRTARNRELITEKEQLAFYRAKLGVAGLSIGSSVVLTVVLEGGCKHIKIADHDKLALSNINRIKAGIDYLGAPKTIITARQIYEINPFARVEIFNDGLTASNIAKFFSGLDIVVDEIDNLAVKYLIRQNAKKNRTPVVMGADNGDSVVVDIERYDLKPNTVFFHGRMGGLSYKKLINTDKLTTARLITKYVGIENIPVRMAESLLSIGKTIVSWPQLGGTALLNSAIITYCLLKIVNKQALINGRCIFSLDEKFGPGYNTIKARSDRQKLIKKLKINFGI